MINFNNSNLGWRSCSHFYRLLTLKRCSSTWQMKCKMNVELKFVQSLKHEGKRISSTDFVQILAEINLFDWQTKII